MFADQGVELANEVLFFQPGLKYIGKDDGLFFLLMLM